MPACPPPELIRGHLANLEFGLLERGTAARLALLAAMAGEHLLLIGPPGTAKSELARRLQHVFADAPYFERLLTRFSVPEELFGPLSLTALEHDRYERLVEGYLPAAGVAFLDEVFKANSAILNALLSLLHERRFDNGRTRLEAPLIAVIAASNEPPEDDALAAFHDRFLLRLPVAAVGVASFPALLDPPVESIPAPARRLTRADVAALARAGNEVKLGALALEALQAARAHAATLSLAVSDRRWRQTARLLKMEAASRGASQVERADLWVLPYALADRPAHTASLEAWLREVIFAMPPLACEWLERAIDAFERQLDIESSAQSSDDGQTGKLALARALQGDTSNADAMPRLRREALEERLRQRYGALHVQARVAQVDAVVSRFDAQHHHWLQHGRAMIDELDAHLWFPRDGLAERRAVHAAESHRLATLRQRLDAVRAGFAALPLDAQADARTPVAIDLA